MLGRSHAIFGAAATAVALMDVGLFPQYRVGLFVVSCGIGTLAALLPDIDSPNATIKTTLGVGRQQSWRELQRWQRKNLFEVAFDAVQWFVARILDIIHQFLPHRGPTHWGITLLGLTGLVWLLGYWFGWPWYYAFAFGVGYTSHLLADGVTIAGVRFLAPFYRKTIRLLPRRWLVRTGSWQEFMMLTLFLALLLAYYWFIIRLR
ncbi:MAG: metal-dependent hydrolase [Chloroflexi bacterium]|nr:metal-dependent hydrolase [Chloroflexota bacterium]